MSQAASFLLVAALSFRWHPPVLLLATMQGCFASLPFLKKERWWIPIQILLPVLALIALTWNLNANWYLLGFFLLGMIYWNAFRTRVPLYLTGREVERKILERLPEGQFEFADLGSGLGGLVCRLAKERPQGRFFGVEIAPLPFVLGKAKCMRLPNCKMVWGSYEKVDLSSFDFVYAFLSPVPMEALYEKIRREMKPGSVFVSNSFEVPGVEADEILEVSGRTLYLWTM